MNCAGCQDHLVAFLEEVLPALEKEQIAAHLQSCPTCSREAAEHARLRDRLLADGRALGSVPLDTPVMDRILREQTLKLRRMAMRKRYAKAGLGLAAAAAIAIAFFAYWPGAGGGKVYGLTEAVEMLRKARTVHLRTLTYMRHPEINGGEPVALPTETWIDLTSSRRRQTFSATTNSGGTWRVLDPSRTEVCDGEYLTRVDHEHRTVRFEKLFAAQRDLMTPVDASMLLSRMSVRPDQLKSYVKADQAELDEQRYDVYRRQFRLPGTGHDIREDIWVSPTTGQIGKTRMWSRDEESSPWSLEYEAQKVELDVEPPPGTFVAEAPDGYKLENTKETAEAGPACGAWNWYGGVTLEVYIAFTLQDGSILACWSVGNKDRGAEERGVWAKAEYGGSLPDLPAVLSGPSDQSPPYAARFVAWTGHPDHSCAWCIYVPKREQAASGRIRAYVAEATCRPSPDIPKGMTTPGPLTSFAVTAEEYGSYMADALRVLSENGDVPHALASYEELMKLAATIRSRPEYFQKPAESQASQTRIGVPIAVVLPEDAARQAQRTVEAFFKAVVEGREAEARSMLSYDPGRAGKVVKNLGALPGIKRANVDSVHAVDGAALVITTEFDFPGGQRGGLAISVIRKDQRWQIRDFDFVPSGHQNDEIDKFKRVYPEAKRYKRQ